ncbi:MAG TPA: hypothetical protein VN066_11305 [Rhodocyclaceae bacterium]|nr:hypothetical protein [Rhodocyclaceae bacterium]
MNQPARCAPQLLTWTSGMAIILFCLTGIASMMGWLPLAAETAGVPILDTRTAKSNSRFAASDCLSCGVIAATCVLDSPDDAGFMAGLVNASGVLGPGLVEAVSGESPPPSAGSTVRHFQTTVRFNNGTTRAFTDTAGSQWQVGMRVRVTDGIIRPQS